MENRRIFHWAFIGAGTLAKQVAKEITASGRHKIVSVYTRRPEKCKAFAEKYDAFAAETANAAIMHEDVDGVYIVTPHTSHFEYARMALNMGKPVLCEKPVTTDADKAAELIGLIRKKKVYFAEAMWTWFAPAANKIKEWLDRGEYGEIIKCSLTYHMKSFNYAPRVTDPELAGGALLDVGIYPITYLYRLFGYPEKIVCKGKLKNGIDTGEKVTLYYSGGRVYTADISIMDFLGLEYLRLKGTEGRTTLPFYHYANKVTISHEGKEKETYEGYGGMLNEFDLAAAEIQEGLTESRYVPHKATLDVMTILDECRRQMGLVYPFEEG